MCLHSARANGERPVRSRKGAYTGAIAQELGRFELAHHGTLLLDGYHISEQGLDHVWTAIALHTTPGIPQYMHPVIALLTAGVEMDVLGIDYGSFTDSDRRAVVQAYPRTAHFKEDILQAFYDGNVKADVLADKDPHFHRGNFCSVIRNSSWHS